MKIIMFQEHEANHLLDKLKLESLEKDINTYCIESYEKWKEIPESSRKWIIEQLHRKFHYHVVKWLQDQGASCI